MGDCISWETPNRGGHGGGGCVEWETPADSGVEKIGCLEICRPGVCKDEKPRGLVLRCPAFDAEIEVEMSDGAALYVDRAVSGNFPKIAADENGCVFDKCPDRVEYDGESPACGWLIKRARDGAVVASIQIFGPGLEVQWSCDYTNERYFVSTNPIPVFVGEFQIAGWGIMNGFSESLTWFNQHYGCRYAVSFCACRRSWFHTIGPLKIPTKLTIDESAGYVYAEYAD